MGEKARKTGTGKKQASKSAKRFQRKVDYFYKDLGINPGLSIPVGNFELFKNISVTETANAGV